MSDQDGTAASDEWSDQETALTEEEVASRDAFVASVRELYEAGTPFFTREMIQLAQDQVDQIANDSATPRRVDRLGFDGKMHPQYVSPSSAFSKVHNEVYLPRVSYKSFESLTMLSPRRQCLDALVSVGIASVCDGVTDESDISQDVVRRAFDECLDLWEQSDEWAGLKERIRPHLSTLPMTIDKIIGFGLGDLSIAVARDVDEEMKKRSSEQHALMLTLAGILEETTGNGVKCHAQDPAYSNICKEILAQRGVDVVHGDRGFLLVDDKSIVLSFSPNVPVRQVIADLTRPAMMVWDIMSKPERSEWRRSRGVWISPHTTDPVSPRVLAMKEEKGERDFKAATRSESLPVEEKQLGIAPSFEKGAQTDMMTMASEPGMAKVMKDGHTSADHKQQEQYNK
ncbi:uncharacterized protein MAM_00758 [Metarhizium album ARSEF 1941]|uniref:SRR1-like domain-containing protein n=1 Tax=Metarhizium album (strain ARSEF 1941) TaxID=1081103 RepID=A0A0B2WZS7_METAS|nr:uncharacterized protein MAM_00758 [Metarhizium album ARSEF 1941]KHO01757.1 hypothetical protein MAM_00758 [Metarhizium album ARSEF 1941]